MLDTDTGTPIDAADVLESVCSDLPLKTVLEALFYEHSPQDVMLEAADMMHTHAEEQVQNVSRLQHERSGLQKQVDDLTPF